MSSLGARSNFGQSSEDREASPTHFRGLARTRLRAFSSRTNCRSHLKCASHTQKLELKHKARDLRDLPGMELTLWAGVPYLAGR